MKLTVAQASLAERAYKAIADAICDGTLASGARLVQDQLADHFGVSRQPIQQALLLLRNDGIVVHAGRRGQVVAPIDLETARHRFQVRAALDGLAARLAAERAAEDAAVAGAIREQGQQILAAGVAAIEAGSFLDMIGEDIAFHAFVYEASGNRVIAPTVQVHWRWVRRLMAEALRHSFEPRPVWNQHAEILAAIVAGEGERAASIAVAHVELACSRVVAALGH